MLSQKTIRAPVYAIGIGVHSGKNVRMTLRPADADTGVRFIRTDIKNSRPVRALVQNVSDTTLSTSIIQDGVQVATVEHLMSGLWGLGIDNLLVELSGEEVPIMDGSAAPFVNLIRSVGLQELPAAKKLLRITRKIKVSQGEAWASLAPYGGFKAAYTFVKEHPVYRRYPKYAEVDFAHSSYINDVSRARSFGEVEELAQAHAINRCLGSSLENAVGIDGRGVMNSGGLRYEDEFVKHKLLDAIGDLYLLGRPVIGAFEGYMSGHALNNKLARAILRVDDAWELVTADEPYANGEAAAASFV